MFSIEMVMSLLDSEGKTVLSTMQFDIPEQDSSNINEIERLFVDADRPLLRNAVSSYFEKISKKKLSQ